MKGHLPCSCTGNGRYIISNSWVDGLTLHWLLLLSFSQFPVGHPTHEQGIFPNFQRWGWCECHWTLTKLRARPERGLHKDPTALWGRHNSSKNRHRCNRRNCAVTISSCDISSWDYHTNFMSPLVILREHFSSFHQLPRLCRCVFHPSVVHHSWHGGHILHMLLHHCSPG